MNSHPPPERIYTLYMPGEERIFFRHLHLMAIVVTVALVCLRVFISGKSIEAALLFSLIVVLPVYILTLAYKKRFADSILLDFDAGKARFSFSDERGSFERGFEEIRRIRFRFYLTFVLDDARIMIKRPQNKKEVFHVLKAVGKLDGGMFDGI